MISSMIAIGIVMSFARHNAREARRANGSGL
jgi:cell division protein FtsW (lipid II flippase)